MVLIYLRYSIACSAGGLDGCKLSKKSPFLVVVAGEAGNHDQKKEDPGEAEPPQTPPLRSA